MDLYKRIKKRREELGLSQEELAKRLGYKSRSTINKIELGINDVTQSKIVAMAKALETTPAYLMGWEDCSSDNSTFHTKYNLLNSLGKSKADSYIDDLCEQEKYTKNTVSENINTTYNTPPRELAAFGAKGTKGTYKKSKREIT